MNEFPNFEVIVGTYEEYLLGYKISPNNKVKFYFSLITYKY